MEQNHVSATSQIIQEENENKNLTNKKIKRFRNKFGMTKTNGHAELVSASLLIRFQNYLGLLFHLPFIKQYSIVLFSRVQNPQVRNDSTLDYFIIATSHKIT